MAKPAGYCATSDARVLEAVFSKTCKLKDIMFMICALLMLGSVAAQQDSTIIHALFKDEYLPPEVQARIWQRAESHLDIGAPLAQLYSTEEIPLTLDALASSVWLRSNPEYVSIIHKRTMSNRNRWFFTTVPLDAPTEQRTFQIGRTHRPNKVMRDCSTDKYLIALLGDNVRFYNKNGKLIKKIGLDKSGPPRYAYLLGSTPDKTTLLTFVITTSIDADARAHIAHIDLDHLKIKNFSLCPAAADIADLRISYSSPRGLLSYKQNNSRICLMDMQGSSVRGRFLHSTVPVGEIILNESGNVLAYSTDRNTQVFNVENLDAVSHLATFEQSHWSSLKFASNETLLDGHKHINIRTDERHPIAFDPNRCVYAQENLMVAFNSLSCMTKVRFTDLPRIKDLTAQQKVFLELLLNVDAVYKQRVGELQKQEPEKYKDVVALKMLPHKIAERSNVSTAQFVAAFKSFHPDNQRYLKERFKIEIESPS